MRKIDEFRQAVELLLQGIVTPQLVPKSILRNTLIAIKAQVQRHFPSFRLIFERAPDFYAMRDFEFGRHDHHLLVQIRVPLTTFDEDFFRIQSLDPTKAIDRS